MTKRILSLLLAAMMVLGSIVIVSAAETDFVAENTWAVDVLTKINVLQGDENGDPMLDNPILRYEMALFLARALTGNTDDAYWAKVENETPFDDLLTHPYNGAATWNYNHGIILGVTDTVFNPNGNITYQDAIVMVVRAWADHFVFGGLDALGFKDELHYPWKHIELADDLHLTDNIDPSEKYLEATSRGVVAQLVYNLITWSQKTTTDDDYLNKLVTYKRENSIGADNFDLAISAKNGDLVKVTGIKDGKVTTEKAIENLTTADFEAYEAEAKVGAWYVITYFTVGDDTVVLNVVQKSIDGADYTNTPSDRDFELVYEATAWKDNDKTKDATEWKVTGIKVGDKVYALVGSNDKLGDEGVVTLNVYGKTLAGATANTIYTKTEADCTKLDAEELAWFTDRVEADYATLAVEDTNGDGTIDTLTVTPYVLATVYTQKFIQKDGKDTKATEWVPAGYAVVSVKDAVGVKSTKTEWTWGVKNADDKDATQTLKGAVTSYVAKDTMATLATATKVDTKVLGHYDVREEAEDKYITIDGVKYGYTYDSLLGFSDELVKDLEENKLADVYDTYKKVVAGDLKAEDAKYITAYVLDNKIVALSIVTATGDDSGDDDDDDDQTETPKFDGIILLDDVDYTDLDLDNTVGNDAVVKIVNGAYYLVLSGYVDGVEVETLLVYLGKATEFKFVNGQGKEETQRANWEAKEDKIIADGLAAVIAAEAGGYAFYTISDGKYTVIPNVTVMDGTEVKVQGYEVNGANYLKHIDGTSTVITKAKKENKITNIEYQMDRSSESYISYTVDGAAKLTYMDIVVGADTEWLFVAKNGMIVKNGAPEFGSWINFADAGTSNEANFLKNGNTYVAFIDDLDADIDGFKYSMHADATYALVDATHEAKLIDNGIRDGYVYYTVHDLFTNSAVVMKVKEDAALRTTLDGIDADDGTAILALTGDKNHELLEIYDIEYGSIRAIASLSYGETAFEFTALESAADLDAVKAMIGDEIQKVFNLTDKAVDTLIADEKELNLIAGVTNATDTTYGTINEALSAIVVGQEVFVFYAAATDKAPASFVAFVCNK